MQYLFKHVIRNMASEDTLAITPEERETIANFCAGNKRYKSQTSQTEAFQLHTTLTERFKDVYDDEELTDLYSTELELIEQLAEALREFAAIEDPVGFLEEAISNYCSYKSVGANGYQAEIMRFKPKDYNRWIPKKGGWVIVTADIPVENNKKPEIYSAYYALPAPLKQEIPLYTGKSVNVDYFKVKIAVHTSFGIHEVHLWPHEYRVVSAEALIDEIGNSFDMINTGGSPQYDTAKLHYLKSRGIPQDQVYRLLMDSMGSPDVCYFKIRPEAKEFWEFFWDCTDKAIPATMIPRLWHCKQTGQPLFKIVTVNEDNSEQRESGQEVNPETVSGTNEE